MPQVSKKKAASRANWGQAVDTIKTGAKRALAILTPHKKKRKIQTDKENEVERSPNETEDDGVSDSGSITRPSCTDDDVFITPAPMLARDFDDLPADAHPLFGFFPTDISQSPSKSSTLGRIWREFTPRVLNRFSPSRKSVHPRVFEDDESILAQRWHGCLMTLRLSRVLTLALISASHQTV
ncbi:hypothetical protein K438DRAFT_1746890 [Mycena galopus ATCC 62051]|nr:hypothetical protein K438DRAFT_1746890 [Mycena galopus ATCC 62051]